MCVSIPSRGFWFFEASTLSVVTQPVQKFQSPRGDFGFLKEHHPDLFEEAKKYEFQSPRGDFGFLKFIIKKCCDIGLTHVSIPSRGFWFFEGDGYSHRLLVHAYCFNPLAGILVF